MSWTEQYPAGKQPAMAEITEYIGSALWKEFCRCLETVCQAVPKIEYSRCSMARGWNIKYKRGSRSVCTLYPRKGYFACLVVIGERERAEAELLLPLCSEAVRRLYNETKPGNGSRWLMIDVVSDEILEDVKRLTALRIPRK